MTHIEITPLVLVRDLDIESRNIIPTQAVYPLANQCVRLIWLELER